MIPPNCKALSHPDYMRQATYYIVILRCLRVTIVVIDKR